MHNHSHEGLIEGISDEYGEILKNSEQAVYIYFDDTEKVCNKKFSDLLGYSSPEEWAKVNTNFPDAFVADDSQENLVTNYQNAMENMTATQTEITWKKKNGEKVQTKVILVPVSFNGHLFALHFVSK